MVGGWWWRSAWRKLEVIVAGWLVAVGVDVDARCVKKHFVPGVRHKVYDLSKVEGWNLFGSWNLSKVEIFSHLNCSRFNKWEARDLSGCILPDVGDCRGVGGLRWCLEGMQRPGGWRTRTGRWRTKAGGWSTREGGLRTRAGRWRTRRVEVWILDLGSGLFFHLLSVLSQWVWLEKVSI